MAKQMTLQFELEKETPGTLRYQEVTEVGRPEKIGKLYIKKIVAATLGNPALIEVTITTLKDGGGDDD